MPEFEKMFFLHQLVTNKDIIIDANTSFSYNEHLNMSKKIIEKSNFCIKNNILKKPKNSKMVLPSIHFMFLSEEQKENILVQVILVILEVMIMESLTLP